jgi:hypothetical protein
MVRESIDQGCESFGRSNDAFGSAKDEGWRRDVRECRSQIAWLPCRVRRGIELDCLREYFAWREEMAAAIDNPGRPGEAHSSGPIQVLLARTESRLATTLDARLRDLVGELHLLQGMIDRHAVSYFLHTPEVPAELQATAVASANRRYRNWRRTVQRFARSGSVNGDTAVQLSLDGGAEA